MPYWTHANGKAYQRREIACPGEVMMKSKTKLVLVVAFCVLGAFLIVFFSAKGRRFSSSDFVSNQANIAAKLYTKIVDADLEDNYPLTPESVIDMNNDIVYMSYGQMILNEDLLKDILLVQRNLFSRELLEGEENSFERQFQRLKDSLDELAAQNVTCIGMERVESIYSDDNRSVTISVRQFLNANEIAQWYYLLIRDSDGRWKIQGWTGGRT